MIKNIKRKLENSKGISILFAMLMLLVAALVCTIIITAALTSAKVSSRDLKDQQAYLTVSSAAQLMKSKIDGSSWKKEIVSRSRDGGAEDEETIVEKKGDLSELLSKAVDYINDHQGISSYVKNLNIDASDTDTNKALEVVRAKFEMDSNYNIVVTFTLDDSKDRVSPAVVLSVSATSSQGGEYEGTDENGNTVYITELQKLSWDNGIITTGRPGASVKE